MALQQDAASGVRLADAWSVFYELFQGPAALAERTSWPLEIVQAIDAYRILLFRPDEIDTKQPYGSAMITAGWWSGYGFIGGAIALWLGGETIGLSWPAVYSVAAVTYVVLTAIVLLMPEPARDPAAVARSAKRSIPR